MIKQQREPIMTRGTSDDNEDEQATGTSELINDETVTEKCEENMGTKDENMDENNNVGGSIKLCDNTFFYSDKNAMRVSEEMIAMMVKKTPRVTGVTSMSLQ